MLPIHIRKARKQDLDTITKLAHGLMAHHVAIDPFYALDAYAKKSWKKYATALMGDNDAHILIATAEERIIGYCIGKIIKRPPIYAITQMGDIPDCFVNEKYRRQNTGLQLVAKMMYWFRERGITYVGGQVDIRNTKAVKFWQSQGFHSYIYKMNQQIGGK